LSSGLRAQETFSLGHSVSEQFEVIQNLDDLRDWQINQHTSNLGSLLLSDELNDEVEDGGSYLVLVVWVIGVDGVDHGGSLLEELVVLGWHLWSLHHLLVGLVHGLWIGGHGGLRHRRSVWLHLWLSHHHVSLWASVVVALVAFVLGASLSSHAVVVLRSHVLSSWAGWCSSVLLGAWVLEDLLEEDQELVSVSHLWWP